MAVCDSDVVSIDYINSKIRTHWAKHRMDERRKMSVSSNIIISFKRDQTNVLLCNYYIFADFTVSCLKTDTGMLNF